VFRRPSASGAASALALGCRKNDWNSGIGDTTFCAQLLKLNSMRQPMFRSMLRPVRDLTLRSGAAAALSLGLSIFALSIFALLILAAPINSSAAEALHCLTGDEQRAAIANGKAMPLATVIQALHRAPRDVVKAQLCQEPDRLVYRLTLLGRDGKVKRAIVDGTNGAMVGER
jgi:hypothetical protein